MVMRLEQLTEAIQIRVAIKIEFNCLHATLYGLCYPPGEKGFFYV